jgi:hypothetical protein
MAVQVAVMFIITLNLSHEGFEAVCEACEKTFYDQKSAEKHATSKAHIRKWNNVYGQGDDDDE